MECTLLSRVSLSSHPLMCGDFISIFLLFCYFPFRCEWLSNRDSLCRKLRHLQGTFFFFFDRYHYITGYLEINQFVIHLVWVICYTLSKAGNPAWSSPTLSLLPNSESLLLSSTRLLTRKHVTREMCWTGALDASDSSLESCNYWSFVQCGLGTVYAFLTHYDL